jgi:hypothetical protein
MKYYNCPQTDELYVKYDKIIELLTSETKMKKKNKTKKKTQCHNVKVGSVDLKQQKFKV